MKDTLLLKFNLRENEIFNSLSPNIIYLENCQNIILYFWIYFYYIRRLKYFYDLSKSFL